LRTQKRRQSNDYAPHYAKYVMLVQDGRLYRGFSKLKLRDMKICIGALTDQKAIPHAPGQMVLKECLGTSNAANGSLASRSFASRAIDAAPGIRTGRLCKSFERLTPIAQTFRLLEESPHRRAASLCPLLDDASGSAAAPASGKEVSVLAMASSSRPCTPSPHHLKRIPSAQPRCRHPALHRPEQAFRFLRGPAMCLRVGAGPFVFPG